LAAPVRGTRCALVAGMRKHRKSKLSLSRETLRSLDQLRDVRGAGLNFPIPTTLTKCGKTVCNCPRRPTYTYPLLVCCIL
jgi:hypothetical protein